jgi:ParB/RepB/Spo0J family partition protein
VSVALPPREFCEVSIDLIDEPQLPSRSEMDDQKLEELAESIRANGLLQPIVVGRVGERFEVIAGHRRRIACARAGLRAVPCIVYPSKDISAIVIQAHENARREDLNPADEALWFMELLEQHCGGDVDQLCALVGEKLAYVDNRIALFRGDTEVFAALKRGDIGIGVAQELNKWTDERYRRHYLDLAVRGGATRTVVAGWYAEWKQMFAQQPEHPLSGQASIASMPDTSGSPFTCIVCQKNDNVHLIRQVDVHQHCKMAILDPLLASARGES